MVGSETVRRGVSVAGLVVSLAAVRVLAAGGDASPLTEVRDADPLELARVVDRIGDGPALWALVHEGSGAVRLAAVRASPWLHEPLRAVPGLVELLAGCDSELAPAAALALERIVGGIDAHALARAEFDPSALQSSRGRLAGVARSPRARADIRACAARVEAMLAAAGIPSG